MAQARPLAPFLCDVVFRVAEDVYVGPDSGITPEDWASQRIPLPVPDLPCRLPGGVVTADLLGREEVLADHAARVRRVLEAHGKAAAPPSAFPLFTPRPVILGQGTALASWPWSDTLPEAARVLQLLAGAQHAEPGTPLLDDEEQGWHLRMVSAGGTVCFVEWDAEGPPPPETAWRVDAASLARQAASALTRLRTIHARLQQRLGLDVWS